MKSKPIFECGFCSYEEDDSSLIKRCKSCEMKRRGHMAFSMNTDAWLKSKPWTEK